MAGHVTFSDVVDGSTAVPAISECLWRSIIRQFWKSPEDDRSPRDFRVLVAAPSVPLPRRSRQPQSPRFQSACGGFGTGWKIQRSRNRSPRDFRVLVAARRSETLPVSPEPQSPRFQSACGGDDVPTYALSYLDRSPRDFRVLVAAKGRHNPRWPDLPQSPRFQSACGGWITSAGVDPSAHRSPRDFRVLVAAPSGPRLHRSPQPQSPRFQSACGGLKTTAKDCPAQDRSPRDFRVLVAGESPRDESPMKRTAVPAISECLWRLTKRNQHHEPKLPQSPRFQSACGGVRSCQSLAQSLNRSPRDFRVLVAAKMPADERWDSGPQSPRFQSACGGSTLAATKSPRKHRSPRDFRVLVAGLDHRHRHRRHVPQSPRFQSACGGGCGKTCSSWCSHTAVPAISECLWRQLPHQKRRLHPHRSPRDFRVLVAAPRMSPHSASSKPPQSPRFQSACGGQRIRNRPRHRLGPQSPRFQSACGGHRKECSGPGGEDRSPRDFRVLVAAATESNPPPSFQTAVPAISECLWRRKILFCHPWVYSTAVPAISECLWRHVSLRFIPGMASPQSPRFQSACGGVPVSPLTSSTAYRSPRDFRVLVAVLCGLLQSTHQSTAVPAISECLWRS